MPKNTLKIFRHTLGKVNCLVKIHYYTPSFKTDVQKYSYCCPRLYYWPLRAGILPVFSKLLSAQGSPWQHYMWDWRAGQPWQLGGRCRGQEQPREQLKQAAKCHQEWCTVRAQFIHTLKGEWHSCRHPLHGGLSTYLALFVSHCVIHQNIKRLVWF